MASSVYRELQAYQEKKVPEADTILKQIVLDENSILGF